MCIAERLPADGWRDRLIDITNQLGREAGLCLILSRSIEDLPSQEQRPAPNVAGNAMDIEQPAPVN